jgi:hypothetical protein
MQIVIAYGARHLLHAAEHVRLALTVTVRADTKVDLAGVLVRLERLSNTCIGCS